MLIDTKKYNFLNNKKLIHWYTVYIETHSYTDELEGEKLHKKVRFHSTIHCNKNPYLTFNFDNSYSDYEILKDKDVITEFYARYGTDCYVHN